MNVGIIGKGALRVAHTSINNKTGEKWVHKFPINMDDPIHTSEKAIDMSVEQYKHIGGTAKLWNKLFDAIGTISVVDANCV